MKKVISVLLVALLIGSVAFAATPGNRISPGIGFIPVQGGTISDAQKTFRMVRYMPATATANSLTLSADTIVIWDTNSDDGITVTTTTTSGDTRVAGVLANACLTPDPIGNTAAGDRNKRNWTWLQTYGLADVYVQDNGTLEVGQAIGCSTTAGNATSGVTWGSATGTVQGVAGFAYDKTTGTSSNTGEVFVRCQ